MPGGSERNCVCDSAVTSAIASSIFAFGWKKILTTAMPFSDVDSMCSISLTAVDSPRS